METKIEDIKEFKGFRVGMKITILRYPGSWSSLLNNNYPGNAWYPYNCIIKSITIKSYDDEGDSISMTDGKYGWDLGALIADGVITSLTKERNDKLKKLNEI